MHMLLGNSAAPELLGYLCSLCFRADSTEAQRFPGTQDTLQPPLTPRYLFLLAFQQPPDN